MFTKAMSSAQTRYDCGGELAHRSNHTEGCIGVLSASGACLARTAAERRHARELLHCVIRDSYEVL